MRPLLGTWPATQAYALTGTRSGDPLVQRPALNPLSHTNQGPKSPCISKAMCIFNISQILCELITGLYSTRRFTTTNEFCIYCRYYTYVRLSYPFILYSFGWTTFLQLTLFTTPHLLSRWAVFCLVIPSSVVLWPKLLQHELDFEGEGIYPESKLIAN